MDFFQLREFCFGDLIFHAVQPPIRSPNGRIRMQYKSGIVCAAMRDCESTVFTRVEISSKHNVLAQNARLKAGVPFAQEQIMQRRLVSEHSCQIGSQWHLLHPFDVTKQIQLHTSASEVVAVLIEKEIAKQLRHDSRQATINFLQFSRTGACQHQSHFLVTKGVREFEERPVHGVDFPLVSLAQRVLRRYAVCVDHY